MMKNNSAIAITDLKKKYGDVIALKGIDLHISKGSFFGLLGPNGAGKTTTINIITGLVKITSGTVQVMGYDVINEFRQSRKQIGLSPQEFNFDHFFTIRHMLSLQAGYYGFSKNDMYSNTTGILFYYLQLYIPFFQNFTPKYLYNYPKLIHDSKINNAVIVENYEEITFFMAINIKNLLPKQYAEM